MIDLFSVGQALGFLSFGLGISTFYQKDDRQLKILMFVFNINHLLHYLLLGSTVSAVLPDYRQPELWHQYIHVPNLSQLF